MVLFNQGMCSSLGAGQDFSKHPAGKRGNPAGLGMVGPVSGGR